MANAKGNAPLFVGKFPDIEKAKAEWRKHGFELEVVPVIAKVKVLYHSHLQGLDPESFDNYLSEESKESIEASLKEHAADAVYLVSRRHREIGCTNSGQRQEEGEITFLPVKLKPITAEKPSGTE